MVTTNEPNVYETGVLDSNAEGNFVYTTLDAAINWIRKNSLWPMPMGLSCCAIEFMAVACSRYDLSGFGSEVTRFSPRQADVMIVAGTVTYKLQGDSVHFPQGYPRHSQPVYGTGGEV